MVKVMGNLNRWLTRESIQEMLGWSPENIDLLVNGLSKSVAVTPDNLILINLNNLRNHLVSVKRLADPILEGSVSKKIKKPRAVSEKVAPETASERTKKPKIERMSRQKRIASGQLTGKQVAQKLNCRYSDIPDLIEKHGLKAGKFGRGYYVKPEDLEKFLSDNEDLVNSLQLPNKEVVTKEQEIVQEAPEQKGNEAETPKQEEKKTEASEDDLVMPSFPGLPDQATEAEESIEKDLLKEPVQTEAPEKENIEPEKDLSKEEDRTAEKQALVQNEDQNKESIEANSDPPVEEEQISEKQKTVPRILSYVTIKKCKHGCKTDDVAFALGLSINTPIRWINNEAVRAARIPGLRGEEYYIEPESLRDFLMKERNTLVTFNETKIPKQLVGPMLPSDR